jgi:type II secretory ATPase GspE/PulE/Tfp pilus assembly ATPase PilB-like protein
MRLLDESSQIVSLDKLGLLPGPLEILKRNIKKPHGIILVTGPTGSGKTTTLYAILNILNTPKVNISTIEDPIEYRMPRINQSQVNPKIGYTFATGLRALMRQDPNIIMVGEIRDNETAEIAAHAAMTGHLVLSTLHTNDAAGAIPRIQEMGVPSFLVASTTNLIIAQRLVRKICPKCKKSYNLTKSNIKEIETQLNIKFKYVLETLKLAGEIETTNISPEELNFYQGRGCKECNEGYRGRMGIFELLEINTEVSGMILNKASHEALKNKAAEQKMISMLQDGIIKAKKGITSIEEVLRVTKD